MQLVDFRTHNLGTLERQHIDFWPHDRGELLAFQTKGILRFSGVETSYRGKPRTLRKSEDDMASRPVRKGRKGLCERRGQPALGLFDFAPLGVVADLPHRGDGFCEPSDVQCNLPVTSFPASLPANFPDGKLNGKLAGKFGGKLRELSCGPRATCGPPADAPQVAQGWLAGARGWPESDPRVVKNAASASFGKTVGQCANECMRLRAPTGVRRARR